VVIGIISLASAMAPMDGHVSSPTAVPPVPPPITSVPPPSPTPENYPRQGQ
jgi:hypothetical protein